MSPYQHLPEISLKYVYIISSYLLNGKVKKYPESFDVIRVNWLKAILCLCQ